MVCVCSANFVRKVECRREAEDGDAGVLLRFLKPCHVFEEMSAWDATEQLLGRPHALGNEHLCSRQGSGGVWSR